jgi:hypothetical protein
MSTVRTYNSAKVMVIFNGFPLSGFADGTFVGIVMQNDGITTQVGADGEIARAINSDRRCTVTVTLQQTSPANDFLSTMFSTDILTCGGIMGPILVQDLCGETIFMAPEAWIVKPADAEFGKEIQTRAWAIHTGAPTIYSIGGNAFSVAA